ncbi:MAG: hypothetical protein ED557_10950 [Balneola sp.]|nr:MAG: hypothetical protein ED557_10950 [Balneola sp.]
MSYEIHRHLFFLGIIACESTSDPIQETHETEVILRIKHKSTLEILVCAHRATVGYLPENSLSAIRESVALGVDIIELDVRTTADDSLVIMHDHDIDRTTNGSGYVSSMSYSALQEYFLTHADSLTNEKIPTLREVLYLTQNEDVILNLDLKDVNTHQYYELLEEFKMQYQVMSYIWDEELFWELLEKDSLYAVLPLANTIQEVRYFNSFVDSKLIHFTEESYQPEIIEEAKSNGQLIFINSLWEIDDLFIDGQTQEMDSLIAHRPAIIQTDYPKELIDYLKQKGLR